MTCSSCGARVVVQRTSFCPRCLLMAADAETDAPIIDIAAEAPPCQLLSVMGESPRATTFLGEQRWPVRRLVAFRLLKNRGRGVDAGSRQDGPRHPNIAPVLERGRLGQRSYVMTEYVGGGPLPKCCDRHRLDAAARLDALLAIVDAITVAHKDGIVHGSLTASNLLCDSRPPFPVRIVDFAIDPGSDRTAAELEAAIRADLEAISAVAHALLHSPIVRMPAGLDVPAALDRLVTSTRRADDMREALEILAANVRPR